MDINSIVSQLINAFVMIQMRNEKTDSSQLWNTLIIMLAPMLIIYLKDNFGNLIKLAKSRKKFKTEIVLNMSIERQLSNTIYVRASTIVYGILYKYINSDYCKLQAKETTDFSIPNAYLIKNKYTFGNTYSQYYAHYFLPICGTIIHVEDDIYLKIITNREIKTIKDGDSDKKNPIQVDIDVFKISILSKNNDIIYVENWIEQMHDKYMNFCNMDKITKLQIFINETDGKNCFQNYLFKTTKNFNSIFFKEKETLINRLDTYISNSPTKYSNLGISHTLGLLFHGVPGTGKTSAIKAIANYLKRNIITINIKNYKTIHDLRRVFYSESIVLSSGYNEYIPFNKRIYVFEEIDCSDEIEKNPLICREYLEKHKSERKIRIENSEKTITSVENGIPSFHYEKPNFSLQEFLELLDGVIENEDRIIIFTTNYPDRIDKALLRPGRIDMIIEFKKLRREDINNYHKLWFNESIPKNKLSLIKDNIITQAQIGKLFMETPRSEIITKLIQFE